MPIILFAIDVTSWRGAMMLLFFSELFAVDFLLWAFMHLGMAWPDPASGAAVSQLFMQCNNQSIDTLYYNTHPAIEVISNFIFGLRFSG